MSIVWEVIFLLTSITQFEYYKSNQPKKLPLRNDDFINTMENLQPPKNLDEGNLIWGWRKVIHFEMESIETTQTWELVDLLEKETTHHNSVKVG